MKPIRGQSQEAQNARLDRACCPIHGLYMGQICGWFYPENEPPFTLVACDRSDCEIVCKSFGPEGPVEVLSREQYEPLELFSGFGFLEYLDYKRTRGPKR